MTTQGRKQNYQNQWGKRVKICAHSFRSKLETQNCITKTVMSKMDEKHWAKMTILLRTTRPKMKLLKFNCFLRHFWRAKNGVCAAPWDSSQQTRGAILKKSGREWRFEIRAPVGEKDRLFRGQAFRRGPVAKIDVCARRQGHRRSRFDMG